MNRAIFSAALFLFAIGAAADETKVDSRIDSIGAFKNGLAVVQRSVAVDGPGVYRLEDVPTPVHGTFWIDSDAPVETQVTMRDIISPMRSRSPIDFQQDLVGRKLTIQLRGEKPVVVSGTVVALERPKGDEAWNRTYQQPQYGYYGYYNNGAPPSPASYLIVQDGDTRTYVDSSQIATVMTMDAKPNITHRQPVLLLTVTGDKKPSTIRISYLAKGFARAPSYRVVLRDDKTLSIEQQAVLKNEMEDVSDAQISLISGYPSIQFQNVTSPLSLTQNWADFFAQLAAGESEEASPNLAAMGQQAVMGNSAPMERGPELPAAPIGEGSDIHYQSIGRRSLAEGDSLLLPVASATTPYARIVEWVVRDNRDADGRIEEGPRYGNSAKPADSAWDAVRFKNAFAFPMTTAPAMVQDKGRFAGQRLSYWVNVGDETTLQITKALSIVTRAEEHESAGDGDRSVVYIGGQQYRKVSVEGDLSVSNHRDQPVDLVIRRRFSGDLVSADEKPKQELREEGVYSVNRRNELTWTLTLKAGEEKTLHYAYTVMVE